MEADDISDLTHWRCDHRKNLINNQQKQHKIDEVFDDNLKNNLSKKSENQKRKRCRRSLATKKSAAISSVSQHNNNRKQQKVLYFNTARSTKCYFRQTSAESKLHHITLVKKGRNCAITPLSHFKLTTPKLYD